MRFTQSAYTDGDCNSFDTLHQNFVGYGYVNSSAPLYTPYVTFNTQYCVVYTVSSDSLKLYVDGILKWKEKKTYAIGTNSQDLFLGRKNNGQYPFWFHGVMDEVRIYNRAINAEEVSALCPSSILPVTLTKFEANIINKYIKLSWNVENNDEIRNYTIERSLTGSSNFIPIRTISASATHSYSFIDNSVNINQNYYYRLAILENNNLLTYSAIKFAKINTKISYWLFIQTHQEELLK